MHTEWELTKSPLLSSFSISFSPSSKYTHFLSGSILFLFPCLLLLLSLEFVVLFSYLRMTTWTSTNPDYWTIYEVDDWEMDRDDIDVLEWNHQLGHGSFGTVYRGLVHTLHTPARLCYADPTNVPVAIKVVAVFCSRRTWITTIPW